MKSFRYILLALTAIATVSCISDIAPADMVGSVNRGGITLSLECDSFNHYQIGTKSSVSKTTEETQIKSYAVFFFDTKGDIIPFRNDVTIPYSTENGYILITKGKNDETAKTTITLDDEFFKFPDSYSKKAYVYVAANFDQYPTGISSIDELENYYYVPADEDKRNISMIPASGMPMYGYFSTDKEPTLIDLEEEKNYTMVLKSLMAKIEFNINLEKSANATANFPQILIQNWTIHNAAGSIRLGGINGTKTDFEKDIIKINSLQPLLPGGDNTIYPGGNRNIVAYVFENIQTQKLALEDVVEIPSDDELEEMDLTREEYLERLRPERYKAYRADEDAAIYISFTGTYVDVNQLQKNAVLKFYLGANNVDDYKVKRNSHYYNYVNITGLESNNEDHDNSKEHFLYDSRVEITMSTENPYYLSVLREHDMDAHFGVTPIDFHIFGNIALKVEVDVDWIRMEKISAEHMKNGTTPTPANTNYIKYINAGGPWKAGHCKRQYFVTDMLSNSNYGLTQSCVVNTTRDRVYLYVDEYTDVNSYTDTENPSRTATLTITQGTLDANGNFKSSNKSNTIQIKQRGLLKVSLNGKNFYIEQIEEYLDNYDPYDDYNTDKIYPGLEWGASGHRFSSYLNDNFCGADLNGVDATNQIIEEVGQNGPTLNGVPGTAAEYCYSKNKRNNSGKVTTTKWYLPSISDLEAMIVQHQSTFNEFRTEFYWSSAAAKKKGGLFGLSYEEHTEYARATRYNHERNPNVVDNQNKNQMKDFIQSDHNHTYPTYKNDNNVDVPGGKVPRTGVKLRIRAAYRP